MMLWHALNTPGYGATYQSGAYLIRHYVEPQTLGFGIVCARLFKGGAQIEECTGVDALERCQEFAAEAVRREAA